MQHGRRFRTFLCASLLLLFSCSDSGPKTYEVSGRVTWNGEPIPDGEVVLAAADGSPIEDFGNIRDGEYRFRAKPGKKIVRITATRKSGKINSVMGEAERDQYIPEEYNAKSRLTADVTPDGQNRWDYVLPQMP